MNDKKVFMLDVDGIMTDGGFYYTKSGKVMKRFGPDDSDALKKLELKIKIIFVSADEKGFKISKKRINHELGFNLYLLGAQNRILWAREKFPNHEIFYMGDSFTDVANLQQSDFGISTRNSNVLAKQNSKFITHAASGNRAVMEACIFLNHQMKLEADLPSWSAYTAAMIAEAKLDNNAW